MPYKAFISYSHAADGEFADALHDAMEKLAKPWNRRRARQVVLDRTAMAAGSSLGDTINAKLADSEWLVLLAAPEAAQSKWCNDEIDYWAAHKSMDNVVVVLTGGEIDVDPIAQRINWDASPALSPNYRAAVGDEAVPLYEDLRPFKKDVDHANLRNAQFRDEVAKIVGRIEDVDPGELASKEKREFAKAVRLRRAAEIGLAMLTVAAVILGVLSFLNARRATEEAERADANAEVAQANERQAVAEAERADANAEEAIENAEQAQREAQRARSSALASQAIAASPEVPDLAALMALESVRIAPTVDAFISVVDSVVSETHFVWRTTVPDEPIVAASAWSEDGDFAVIGTEFGDVLVVAPDDPEISGVSLGDESIISVALVAGSDLVRTLSFEGSLTTIDLGSGEVVDEVFFGEIVGGAISGDGSTVAIASDDGATTEIVVFDGAGEFIAAVELGSPIAGDCGACVALNHDGTEVAWVETDAVFFDDVVWTWDVDGRITDVFFTGGFVVSLAFVPGGSDLLIGDEEGQVFMVSVSDEAEEDPEPLLTADSEVLAYSFGTAAGSGPVVLATGHLNGSVGIWEFDGAARTARPSADLTRHNDEVRTVVVSADGATVLSGSWDGDIISWLTNPGANHGVLTEGAHEERVSDVTFVGDDATVASAGFDGVVRFWDASSRGLLSESRAVDLAGDDQVVLFSIDAHPNGEVVAVGGTFWELDDDGFFPEDGAVDDFVVLLDTSTGRETVRLSGLPETPESVAFSPDGEHLAVGIATGPVLVWSTDDLDGPPAHELDGFASTTGGISFSGDGRLVAAATAASLGSEAGVWEVATGELILSVPGNFAATVTAVALNAEGSILAWGDDTRLIGLWHIPTDSRIGENLSGHREPISDLEFADVDGDGVEGLLASASDDATARVWEIRARRLVARVEAHREDVTAVAISPDAALMITSSQDESIWVGDLDPETWVRAACELAGRNMSQEEWDALELEGDYIRHCPEYPSGDGAPQNAAAWMFTFTGVDTGEE